MITAAVHFVKLPCEYLPRGYFAKNNLALIDIRSARAGLIDIRSARAGLNSIWSICIAIPEGYYIIENYVLSA